MLPVIYNNGNQIIQAPGYVAIVNEMIHETRIVPLDGRPHSDAIKITERFTRSSADTLDYRMTIDDPKTWAAPWTIEFPLKRDDAYGMYEYACHEGNHALANILSGARAEERDAARKAR
jgi:hypothetical protein